MRGRWEYSACGCLHISLVPRHKWRPTITQAKAWRPIYSYTSYRDLPRVSCVCSARRSKSPSRTLSARMYSGPQLPKCQRGDVSQAPLTPVQCSAVILLASPDTGTHPCTHTHPGAGQEEAFPSQRLLAPYCSAEMNTCPTVTRTGAD